jgi:hypothetical protein
MVPRRTLVGASILGGLVGTLAGADAETAPAFDQQTSERSVERIAEALAGLRDDRRLPQRFSELGPLREAQKTFLRVNGKFPDFIEVGVDVWFTVHDWHVRWQQPLTLGRDGLGRYTIVLNQTTLILRPEVLGAYIGIPYDSK